jgi:2-desacetyl-2-hydroxyethyl bacteriochlorophyllide A dehydrogenase
MTTVQAVPDALRGLLERGEIGGRTVQLAEDGRVATVRYEPAPMADGLVRIRTVRSAISSGTEMTFYGRSATNVYLHKRWNEELRLFEAGRVSMSYPLVIGYRAAGQVIETRSPAVAVGMRVFGTWRHTEFTTLDPIHALAQEIPADLTWDDAVDLGQMGPIAMNAVAYGERQQVGHPAVILGAGVVGLLIAQLTRISGADPVYVVDRLDSRLEIAASLGLEVIHASDRELDIAVRLKGLHGSEGIPVVWECSGSTAALHQAIRLVKRRGMVVAVGFYQGDAIGLDLGEEFHHNGVRIVCGQIGNIHPAETWESLRASTIALARNGRLRLGGLPRLRLPIEEAAQGFEALTRPEDVLQVALSYETEG